ncbi:hypothetical protein V8E54_009896 [Elaphomyces granulatus]
MPSVCSVPSSLDHYTYLSNTVVVPLERQSVHITANSMTVVIMKPVSLTEWNSRLLPRICLIDQPSKTDNLHRVFVKVYTNEYSPSLLSLNSNINPNESASQVESPVSILASADTAGDTSTDDDSESFRKPRSESAWVWSQYKLTTLETTWTPKGKGKGKGKGKTVNDRFISCTRCKWTTQDSTRHGTTSNMIRHLLSIHDISRSGSTSFNQSTDPLSSSPQSRVEVMKTFEKNLTRWIVAGDMAFSSIESPLFQLTINDIPGISMPFKSRNTLTSRISAEFELDRARLVEELAHQRRIYSSHWLSEDFVYKEAVLEFAEIEGTKTGENMGGMVLALLQELNIETKLLSITGDNASNNETLMDTGRASFIRCLAHILNLIVKKLLETLKSGNRASAEESIQQVDNRQYLSTTDSALARLLGSGYETLMTFHL